MTDHIVDTNKKVPPCPVCGVVPHIANDPNWIVLSKECTAHNYKVDREYFVVSCDSWNFRVLEMLGRACRELGIETVEQLKARLAPDPRVAVLNRIGATEPNDVEFMWFAINYAVDNGDQTMLRVFKTKKDELIAAQRGEG